MVPWVPEINLPSDVPPELKSVTTLVVNTIEPDWRLAFYDGKKLLGLQGLTTTYRCTIENGAVTGMGLIPYSEHDERTCARVNLRDVCSDVTLPIGCRKGAKMEIFTLFLMFLILGRINTANPKARIVFIVEDNFPADAAHRLHLLCKWISAGMSDRLYLVELGVCAFCDFLDKEFRSEYGDVGIIYTDPKLIWRCHSWVYRGEKFLECSQEKNPIPVDPNPSKPSTEAALKSRLYRGLNGLLDITRRSDRMILCSPIVPQLRECPSMAGSYFEFFTNVDMAQGAYLAADAMEIGRLIVTHHLADANASKRTIVFNSTKKPVPLPNIEKWHTMNNVRAQTYADGAPREVQQKSGKAWIPIWGPEWVLSPEDRPFLEVIRYTLSKPELDLTPKDEEAADKTQDATDDKPANNIEKSHNVFPAGYLSEASIVQPSDLASSSTTIPSNGIGSDKGEVRQASGGNLNDAANADYTLPSGMRLTPELAMKCEAFKIEAATSTAAVPSSHNALRPEFATKACDGQSVKGDQFNVETLQSGWKKRVSEQLKHLADLEIRFPDIDLNRFINETRLRLAGEVPTSELVVLLKVLLDKEVEHSMQIAKASDVKKLVSAQSPGILSDCAEFSRLAADDKCSVPALRRVVQSLCSKFGDLQTCLDRVAPENMIHEKREI